MPGTSVGDLDESLVDRTIERAYSLTPRAMRGAADKKTKMERLNFLDFQGNVTKAGLLAAGVYPQQFYPKLFIDVAVHVGAQKGAVGSLRFMDRTICEGTLGEMISDAVAAVAKNLRRISTVQGISCIDSLEIPEEVLREAIANAVIHREYGDRFCGQSIAVDVFDDRVEVTNPGGLYGGKTRENLFDGSSRCRNATLVKLMSIVPLPDGAGSPAEGNGSGIPMMIDAMRAHGLAEPLFCPGFDRFKVVLYRSKIEPVDHGGGLIVTALKHYGELGTRELAERTGLTISQVRSRVNALIAQGELELTRRRRAATASIDCWSAWNKCVSGRGDPIIDLDWRPLRLSGCCPVDGDAKDSAYAGMAANPSIKNSLRTSLMTYPGLTSAASKTWRSASSLQYA